MNPQNQNPAPVPQPAQPVPAQPVDTPPPPTMPHIQPLQGAPLPPPIEPDGSQSAGPSKTRRFVSSIVSWVVVPVVIVLVLHTFAFQAFYVEGSSMEPDFHSNDYLIVSKLDMTANSLSSIIGIKSNPNIKRGDVLVFRPPINLNTFFVKRVIGLPGEKVEIKNGRVKIYNNQNPNGFELNEDYIDQTQTTLGEVSITVDQGKYFMLGDNRRPGGSYDSRDWGLLPKENIIGAAYMRLLPASNLGTIAHPSY